MISNAPWKAPWPLERVARPSGATPAVGSAMGRLVFRMDEPRRSFPVSKHVLSVGNCGFDNARLAQKLSAWFDVEITTAADGRSALAMVRDRQFDLVLVNRVFDATAESGLELIAQMKNSPDLAAIPVMLISNFPEYQSKAEELGAVPGFGKQNLNGEAVKRLLSPYLADSKP